jgi:uncharacterized protein involved in exopolysaccharide biosynthesis
MGKSNSVSVEVMEAPTPPPPPTPTLPPEVWWIAAGIIGVAAIGGAVYFLMKKK